MKEKNIKVMVFDLDGTLAESKQPLAPDMALVLQKLLLKIPVAVMSGADFPQFKEQFLKHMPSDSNFQNLFLFPTSAAECLTYVNGDWKDAYDLAFTEREKQKIIAAIRSAVEETGIGKNETLFGQQIEDRGEQITFSALGQEAPLSAKSPWDPDQKKRRVLQETIKKSIPEFGIRIGGTTSIDVTRKGVSKEDGVLWLEKHFGIPSDEMLYIGDALYPGGNDTAVNTTGIRTRQVSGPEEVKKIIIEFIEGA